MRLTYASRGLNRNVSFEFLNRQLVWNAFTEFLLFLLPLVKPARLLRRAGRLATHPAMLSPVYSALPHAVSKRLGLERDAQSGQVVLKSRRHQQKRRGKYWALPLECCPLCFERLEREAGVYVDVHPDFERQLSEVRIPGTNPKKVVSRRQRHAADLGKDTPGERRLRSSPSTPSDASPHDAADDAQDEKKTQVTVQRPSLLASSPNGIRYLDALATTPYETHPCAEKGTGCVYCYYCIAQKLLDEPMADELQHTGGWACLRCGEYVYGAGRKQAP